MYNLVREVVHTDCRLITKREKYVLLFVRCYPPPGTFIWLSGQYMFAYARARLCAVLGI